ncbi:MULTISPECIES: cytochrome P450 [unclassified Nocardia]|uniref:cytochrome P450 n=1 Tax=unclassified Nocardia TaxID=2637762 RepID=UPI001CE3D01E|nr:MULTISPECIES: cytochrome P450 [unclassified Nocardia]
MSALAERWKLDEQRFFWIYGEQGRAPKRVELDERTGIWNVHGHANALQVLNNPAIFSSGTGRLIPEQSEFDEGAITQLDPPRHTKLRKLVTAAFTPRAIAELEPRVHAIVDTLLSKVEGARGFDLITDFAYPLPITVITELLGVPADDHVLIQGWVDRMLSGTTELSLVDHENDSEIVDVLAQAKHITDYLRGLVKERVANPCDDMLTKLVQAEVDGERLTEPEIVNFANALLVAGHVTTTLLIGSTVLCLDAYPEADRAVRSDRSLMPTLLEETLRYFPPITMMARVTNAEVELGGVTIGPDQFVAVWSPTANRDDEVFADPFTFDPAREPNPHLSFGRGAHFCIGAALARREGYIAMNALFDRFPGLRVDPDGTPTFMTSPNLNGLTKLPVVVD